VKVKLSEDGTLRLIPVTGGDECIVGGLFAAFARGGELSVTFPRRDGKPFTMETDLLPPEEPELVEELVADNPHLDCLEGLR